MVSEPGPRLDSPNLHLRGVLEESPHLYGIHNFHRGDPGLELLPTPIGFGVMNNFFRTNSHRTIKCPITCLLLWNP